MANPYWDGAEKTKRHPDYRAEEHKKLDGTSLFVGAMIGFWFAYLVYLFSVFTGQMICSVPGG
jgi:hypothetical protein